MIYRSFEGLRFEALSPSRYIFRLSDKSKPIDLVFSGFTWTLSSGGRKSFFLSRKGAAQWLAEAVAQAEAKYETSFTYAHLVEDHSA